MRPMGPSYPGWPAGQGCAPGLAEDLGSGPGSGPRVRHPEVRGYDPQASYRVHTGTALEIAQDGRA
jgi:hypothetical protein